MDAVNSTLLFRTLDHERDGRRMSWRAVARVIGVSPATFTRLAAGTQPSTNALLAMCDWLDVDPRVFANEIRHSPLPAGALDGILSDLDQARVAAPAAAPVAPVTVQGDQPDRHAFG